MPAYVWICQVCATSNEAGANVCTRCTAPAELNSIEIARRRRALGLDASPEPQPGPIRRQISKCRIWLPGIYVLIGVAWTLNTIITRPTEAFWGTAIVLIGVPGYLYWKRSSKRALRTS